MGMFTKCSCNAVTIYLENGGSNSLKESNLTKFGINLKNLKEGQKSFNCNHCVNKYGLDLCACGSGNTPEECDEKFEACGKPMEVIGKSVEFLPKF